MATGKARPDKPQTDLVSEVVTHNPNGTPESLKRREVTQGKAKSVSQVMVEGEVAPSGPEIHEKARLHSPDTVEGKARGVKPQDPGPTGPQILAEVTRDKVREQDHEGQQAKAAAELQARVKAAQEKEAKERQAADAKMARDAAAKEKQAREEALKKADEDAKRAAKPQQDAAKR